MVGLIQPIGYALILAIALSGSIFINAEEISNHKRAGLRQVFHDDFTHFDHNKWANEIQAHGGGNGEFQIYTPDHVNCYVKDGHLYLRPTLTSDKYGESFLHSGFMDLHKTYGACNWDCYKNATAQGIIPPVMSCKLLTKQAIRYGKVEVWAKMPEGDWLWPAIWLVPTKHEYGQWPRSGEIDMAELRGNLRYAGGTPREVSSTIHFGSDHEHKQIHKKHSLPAGSTYSDGFYKYIFDWTASYIRISVNDVMVLNVTTPADGYFHHYHLHGNNIWSHGGKDAPFDKDFHLILNVAVGGLGGWFPDGATNSPHPKPWHNHDDRNVAMEKFWKDHHNWHGTWHGEKAAMQVRSVTMWTY